MELIIEVTHPAKETASSLQAGEEVKQNKQRPRKWTILSIKNEQNPKLQAVNKTHTICHIY